ncbi:MAG TPA: glycerate kinase [Verrucomicrobiales bacterium]|nr:glycerate kinase [Verrucomicrobiales bacterium]
MTTGPAVLIACDKFKGTLTAAEACNAICEGIKSVWADASCFSRPMADGGEGTARVICEACGGEWLTEEVTGPLADRVTGGWAWLEKTKTAIIEMSEASGLKLLDSARRNPWRATTAGTGELMQAGIRKGAQRLIVGIGGSATNDGGAGMAWAMGYRFLDADGKGFFPLPANLETLAKIVPPENNDLPEVIAACDVTNPLLGKDGATAVYGPQKGVRMERMPAFEAALQHLSGIVRRDLGMDMATAPGAGAAGGLGFGLMTFCRATMQPGFDLVAEVTGLEAAVRAADLVITGEGCIDAQTLHGKGPAGVADMARRLGKPVVAVGGIVDESARAGLNAKFHAVLAAATRETLAQALADPAAALKRAVSGGADTFHAVLGL